MQTALLLVNGISLTGLDFLPLPLLVSTSPSFWLISVLQLVLCSLSPLNLDYITFILSIFLAPLPVTFFSLQVHLFPLSLLSWCSFFLSAIFPALLSPLFLLTSSLCRSSEICFLHGWERVSSGSYFPCVGESAGQEGLSGSYAFRTSEHSGFKGPDSAWTAVTRWSVWSCFSVTTYCKRWLLCFYPLFLKFLLPSCCSQRFPTYVSVSPKLFCCLLQVMGQTTPVVSDVNES